MGIGIRLLTLIGIGSVVLLLLALVAGTGMLLSNRNTRAVGVGVLCGGVAFGVAALIVALLAVRPVLHKNVSVASHGEAPGAIESLDLSAPTREPRPARIDLPAEAPLPRGRDQVTLLRSDGQPPEPSAERDPLDDGVAISSGAPRPAWIGREPWREGNVYHAVVVSDPLLTEAECRAALAPVLERATRSYADRLLGYGAGDALPLERESLAATLLDEEHTWVEELQTSVGPMKRLHALLAFDEQMQSDLADRWEEAIVRERLTLTGGAAAGVLSLLATLLVYLKLDARTGGGYRRPLQLAAAGTIIAAGAATMAAMRWFA